MTINNNPKTSLILNKHIEFIKISQGHLRTIKLRHFDPYVHQILTQTESYKDSDENIHNYLRHCKHLPIFQGYKTLQGSNVTRTEPVIEPVDPKNRNRTGTGKKPDQKTGH
jgi:hypothetical protein